MKDRRRRDWRLSGVSSCAATVGRAYGFGAAH
jgi:hypothetical protein